MRCFKIEYSAKASEGTRVIEVLADSPKAAIEKAGLQNVWKYTVSECITRKLGNSCIILSTELIRRAGR